MSKTHDILDKWAAAQGPEKMDDYRARKNAVSIDGLPALPDQEYRTSLPGSIS